MLYATIVQRKIKRTFREINQGNVQPMLDTLADPFVYVFHDTCIGRTQNLQGRHEAMVGASFPATTWHSIRRSRGCNQRVAVEYARCG